MNANPHFVVCLRPRLDESTVVGLDTPISTASLAQPFVEPALLAAQMSAYQVLPALGLYHAGFVYRASHREFYQQHILAAMHVRRPPHGTSNYKPFAQELFASLAADPLFNDIDVVNGVRWGSERVFMKREVIQAIKVWKEGLLGTGMSSQSPIALLSQALARVKLDSMDSMAVKCQAIYRGYRVRMALRRMWRGLHRLQAGWQAARARQLWARRRIAVRILQYTCRTWLVRRWFIRMRAAALFVQAWYRRQSRYLRWIRCRRGIRVLHALARGYTVRQHVLKMLESVTLLQAVARSFLVRCELHCLHSFLFPFSQSASLSLSGAKPPLLAQGPRRCAVPVCLARLQVPGLERGTLRTAAPPSSRSLLLTLLLSSVAFLSPGHPAIPR